jgi:DNA polymerase-3 subunit alpha
MGEVTPPIIPDCEPWPLIQMLDHERDVIGMYLSGHPLDNYKFQIKHYKFDTIADFNEFKSAVHLHPNPSRSFRIAALVTEAQHRISKRGNKFGVMHLEDYSEKMELMLFGEDYVKYNNYLEPGMVICITGSFVQRYQTSPYEYKIATISLLESVMRSNTKKVHIDMNPKDVSKDFIDFIRNNMQKFPGNSTLKFNICDNLSKLKFGMYTSHKCFEMNDEMANYLQQKPELDIKIELT